VPSGEEIDGFDVLEGRLLMRLHMIRDRDPRLRAKRILHAGGDLSCEACGFDFGKAYGQRGEGYIECHHTVPLYFSGERKTKLSDLALLCSNCHRMIHRSSRWLTIDQLREVIVAQQDVRARIPPWRD
jgi:5-methylcytosine-specific restriction protein A